MPVLQLAFTENRGQLDQRIAFHVQGRETAAYFTAQGMTLAITGQRNATAQLDNLTARLEPGRVQQRWNLKLDFLGANLNVRPEGRAATATRISYFHGPQTEWQTGLPSYGEIVYRDLWPGIDLVYGGTVNRLKYQFVVRPGADPAQIRLAYRGPETPLVINRSGQLEIATPFGTLHDDKPVSMYDGRLARQSGEGRAVQEEGKTAQQENGRAARSTIATKFVLHGKTRDGGYEYGFRVGKYDRRETLVIDPALLVYSGLIGGSGDDEGHAIAVDSAGNAYITGVTTSPAATFPETAGPDLTYNGRTDAFVAKIKADGSGLAYAGYLGGEGDDEGHSIAVDSAGNAYVTGLTTSFETSFPVTGGPDLTFNGAIDAFVAKSNPAGTALTYCGYVGGDDEDEGLGVAVDGSNRAYLTGLTASTEATFPKLIGPKLTFGGAVDAFVARVKADGSGLDYAGYLGGSGDDQGRGIAVDASGNAYIAGQTTSTAASFPMVGTLGATAKGGTDAFVAKVNANGASVNYSGFLGGSGNDEAYGIAVDSAGAAYVTGRTNSTEATFATTGGPDVSFNGGTDAFVAKINAAGSALSYAGFIGGDGDDEGYSIAVDGAGQAYVVGRTTSSDATFPKAAAPDVTRNGGSDGFVARVNAAGNALDYAGYIGGDGLEEAFGVAVSTKKFTFATGRTTSTAATFPLLTGPSLTSNGAAETFVYALTDSTDNPPNPVPTLTSISPSSGMAGGQAFTLTVTGTNFNATSIVRWKGEDRATTFKSATQLEATILATDIVTAGTASVTVFNPAPSGGTSSGINFLIDTSAAFEADVAPRPNGSMTGAVTIADWTQTGRFVAGLETATNGSEFQRADAAPRSSFGDGRLTIADWVQAGRYAAGLDPVVPAGGPTTPASSLAEPVATNTEATPRVVRARGASFTRDQVVTLPIELDANGDENALAFSLSFDPARLRFVNAVTGADASAANLLLNRNDAAAGRIGIVFAQTAGQTLGVGTRRTLLVSFVPTPSVGEVATQVQFSDQVVARNLSDAFANLLPPAQYVNATINLSGNAAAHVIAASYVSGDLAADSMASAFGMNLATATAGVTTTTLPTTLNGTTVKLLDSKGTERTAPLFFVSPTQVNYLIPAQTAEGLVTVTITNRDGIVTRGFVNVVKVAPGLFSADATGKGFAAAEVVYVRSNGTQELTPVARFDATANRIVANPIDVSGDPAFLILYGTGLRQQNDLSAVKVKIGGVDATVEYAGTQKTYAGLDQINVRLPRTLSGRGVIGVEVVVEGKIANPVQIQIK